MIYGTRDIGSLEDDLGEQGIWVEEPLGRTYRAGKVEEIVLRMQERERERGVYSYTMKETASLR